MLWLWLFGSCEFIPAAEILYNDPNAESGLHALLVQPAPVACRVWWKFLQWADLLQWFKPNTGGVTVNDNQNMGAYTRDVACRQLGYYTPEAPSPTATKLKSNTPSNEVFPSPAGLVNRDSYSYTVFSSHHLALSPFSLWLSLQVCHVTCQALTLWNAHLYVLIFYGITDNISASINLLSYYGKCLVSGVQVDRGQPVVFGG